jgi:hypothetical protein
LGMTEGRANEKLNLRVVATGSSNTLAGRLGGTDLPTSCTDAAGLSTYRPYTSELDASGSWIAPDYAQAERPGLGRLPRRCACERARASGPPERQRPAADLLVPGVLARVALLRL